MAADLQVLRSSTNSPSVSYVSTLSQCLTTPRSSSTRTVIAPSGNCRIKKVAMASSHSNNLLQLVDMVCGAVMRSYTASDPGFRDLVKKREKFVQQWPGW